MSALRIFLTRLFVLALLSMTGLASAQVVTVTSNSNPSQIGEFVTFTATVTGPSPAGTVRFLVFATPDPPDSGPIPISFVSANVSQAKWVGVPTLVGNYSIVAQYAGNLGNFSSSAYSQFVLNTRTFPTSTTLVASPANSTPGQNITFTATVSAGVPNPSGVVNFYAQYGPDFSSDFTTLLGSSPTSLIGNNSKANFSISSLPVGYTGVIANFVGNAPYGMSTGSALATVGTLTSTSLSVSPNVAVVGQTVTFSSTVASGAGTPTGSVNFTTAGSPSGPITLAGGNASYQTTFLTPGNFSATATYSPTGNFIASASGTQLFAVLTASTTTNLVSNQNPATQGNTVTFTATVTPQFSGTPTGTMSFFVDGSPIIGVPLSGGSAQFSTSSLAVGSRFVQAFYSGSASFGSSSGSLNQTILALPPAVVASIVSNSNPAQLNEFVTFTAQVAGASPSGTVRFSVDGGPLTVPISLSPLNANLSTASWVASALTFGNHSVVVNYSGNLGNVSSAAFTQNVIQTRFFTSSTSLIASPNPSNPGDSVTFTATMNSLLSPTGVVNFYAPNASGLLALLASQSAVASGNASSTASFSTSSLPIGTMQVFANFVADAPFLMSTGNRSVTVLGPAATTTLLNINPNPAAVGQTVTFTSTVTSGSGTPTGSVVFTVAGTPFGPFNLVNGSVAYQTTFPNSGNLSTSVAYTPTGNFLASNSGSQGSTVNQASTTTNLVSNQNPSTQGDLVTFTATVVPQFSGTPTGTMSFFVDGSPIIGVPLSGGSAQFSTSSLAVGGRFIQAFYSGSANFGSSSGSVNQTVLAIPPAATVLVLSNSNPAQFAEFVTFTAEVQGAAPRGTVVFVVDGAPATPLISLSPVGLNLSVATWVAPSLTLSNHSVLVLYGGNLGNFSSPVFSQLVINTRTFPTTTTLAAAPNPAIAGSTVTFTATMSSVTPPTGVVNFYAQDGAGLLSLLASQAAVSGGGNVSTANFSTSSLNVGVNTVFANFAADAPFKMSSGNRSVTVVNSAPTNTVLTITPNPANAGQTVTFTANVTSGFGTPTGTVTFTVNGSPTSPVPLVNGVAIHQTAFGSNGNFSATATYAPTGVFVSSQSASTPYSVTSPPQLSLVVSDVTRTEGNTGTANLNFVVTRPAGGTAVSFTVTTVSGTAQGGGVDYNDLVAAPFTLGAAAVSRTVSVPIVGELLDENNETFQAIFTPTTSGVTINGLASDTRTGTITDNDTATFSIGDVTVNEGAGTAVFTVTQSVPSINNTSVTYTVADVQAIAGLDYATTTIGGPTGTLTFLASTTPPAPQTLTIDILDDLLDEPAETFRVQLVSAVNAALANGANAIGVGTIQDTPDPQPNISINNVTAVEGTGAGATTFYFTVTMDRPSGRSVLVTASTQDLTAQQPADYTPKTQNFNFAPGFGLTRTFAVDVAKDAIAENDEVFNVVLSGVTNGAITTGMGVGTIINDDAGVQIDDVSIGESGGSLVFTVTRTATAGAITFNYATGSGTATGGASCTAGTDFVTTAGSGSISAGTGVATTTITVPICDDAVSENHESFTVNLTAVSGATLIDGVGLGTINNDDAIPAGSLKISEFRYAGPGGAADQFVEIANTSASPVTIGALDLSPGFAVASLGTTLFVIPNGATIPARGHYLATNSGYSLANYGGTNAATGDAAFQNALGVNDGIALFDTTNYNGSSVPLDAVGFALDPAQYVEPNPGGAGLAALTLPASGTTNHAYVRRHTYGGTSLQDTNDSVADWALVATDAGAFASMNLILGGPSPENLTGETERANADITLGYCDPSAGGSAGDNYLFTPAGGANPGNKFIELRRTLTNNVPATTFTNIRFKATSLSTLNSNDGGNQADFRPATSITRTGLVCGSANSLTLLDPPAYDALLGTPSGTMGGLNSSLRLPVTLNPASTVGMNFKVYYTTSGKPGFYWLTVTAKP